MNLALGTVAYALTGYLVFRGWLRLCPVTKGWFGNAWDINMVHGWFVPALNGRLATKWEDLKTRRVPVGLPIEGCLWISVLGWPGVLVALAGGKVCRTVERLAKTAVHTAVPPEKDKMLTEAEREVERLLKDI